jgi:hypothetical protein
VIEVRVVERLFRSVVTVDVGLYVLEVKPVPRPLIAVVRAVWKLVIAVETALLLSAVPVEIDVCSALAIARLNAWYAAPTAWF